MEEATIWETACEKAVAEQLMLDGIKSYPLTQSSLLKQITGPPIDEVKAL